MSEHFQISWTTALAVVLTTAGIYLAFIVLVRLVGTRSLSSMSSFDFACVVAFGAVLGRTALLAEPSLPIGVIALVTFFAMQGLMGVLRRSNRADRLVNRTPVLLVRDGTLLVDTMRKVHVAEDEVRQAIRRAGISRLSDVRCVVLERNGAMSVIRTEPPIDPWLMADVAGQPVNR